MSDYRLKVSVQNANIVRAIEEAGFKSVAEMCRIFDLCASDVSAFINFRKKPTDMAEGRLTGSAEGLCLALGRLPEDLWTDEQLGMKLPRNVACVDVTEDQMEEAIKQLDHRKMLGALMGKAKLRESRRILLSLRNEDEQTFEQIGRGMGVSTNRARQIEQETLRVLRVASSKIGGREAADI